MSMEEAWNSQLPGGRVSALIQSAILDSGSNLDAGTLLAAFSRQFVRIVITFACGV